MNEIAKTEARNYLSAAGFFLIGGYFLLRLINIVGGSADSQISLLGIVVGITLIIVSTILIALRKRDMISLLFMMLGALQLITSITQTSSVALAMTITGITLIVGLVMLTGKDRKKWVLFPITVLLFLVVLLYPSLGFGTYYYVLMGILILYSLYLAFSCASERLSLPGRNLICSDEVTDFKASGSALGYLLFALTTGLYVMYYIVGEELLPIADIVTTELVVGILFIFLAILLMVLGKMRFTPVMFLLMGLTNLLAMFSSDQMFIGIGILYLIIGLFALLRKESRILPGIMLIIYGCSAFFSILIGMEGGSDQVLSIVHDGIPCLIAIYLSFVVYSYRRLPRI